MAFVIRHHKNKSIGVSPFMALYGRLPYMPIDSILAFPPSQQLSLPIYTQSIITRIQFVHQFISHQLNSVHYPDQHPNASPPPFSVGDLVYVYTPTIEKGVPIKLTPQFHGPYSIHRIIRPFLLYEVELKIISLFVFISID